MPTPDQMRSDLLAFAHTDLLYYFADSPPELLAEQEAGWNPLLAWAEGRLGAPLARTRGIMPIRQAPGVEQALEKAIALHGPLLEPLYRLTRMYGSLLLALAVLERHVSASEAFRLSRIDEDFQKRQWGADEEAEAREEALRKEVEDLMTWIDSAAQNG